MKAIFKLLILSFLWIVQGCSPLGSPFDETVSNSHYYNNSKTDIIYSPMGNWFELGKREMRVDIASFEVLNKLVSKDKNQAYFEADKFHHQALDLVSFHVRPGLQMTNIGFDKDNVYWLETTYKDGNSIAVAKRVESADPATFEQLDFDWSKDDKHYFFKHKIVAVDYLSFKKLHPYFSKDNEKVYNHYATYFTSIDADTGTFKIIEGSDYAIDQNHIFCMSFEKEGKNAPHLITIAIKKEDNLKLYNENYLGSGNKLYFLGKEVIGADINSFELVSQRYAKDRNKIYFENHSIPNADTASFRLSDDGFGVQDKHGRYINGSLAKD